MEITVTKFGISTKSKEGIPFIDKNGKPYSKAYLKCKEYGDRYVSKNYVSAFELDRINAIKEGDVIDIEIKENEYNGKKYLNFEFKKDKVSRKEFDDLVFMVNSLAKRVATIEAAEELIQEQTEIDQLPF